MKVLRLICAVLLLASGRAAALDCANALTTPDINECASVEQKKVEARLNTTYKTVLAYLDHADPIIKDDAASAKLKLIEAQRAWIKFREADCQAQYEFNASGTIRTVLWISCMQAHAEQRTRDLESFSSGGD